MSSAYDPDQDKSSEQQHQKPGFFKRLSMSLGGGRKMSKDATAAPGTAASPLPAAQGTESTSSPATHTSTSATQSPVPMQNLPETSVPALSTDGSISHGSMTPITTLAPSASTPSGSVSSTSSSTLPVSTSATAASTSVGMDESSMGGNRNQKVKLAFLSWANSVLQSASQADTSNLDAASSVSTLSSLSDGVLLLSIARHLFPSVASSSAALDSTASEDTQLLAASDEDRTTDANASTPNNSTSAATSTSSASPTPSTIAASATAAPMPVSQADRAKNLNALFDFLSKEMGVESLDRKAIPAVSGGQEDAIVAVLRSMLQEHVREILVDKLGALQQYKTLPLFDQLLAWVNLNCRSPTEVTISNWTDDWKDGSALLGVMRQLSPTVAVEEASATQSHDRQVKLDSLLHLAQIMFRITAPFSTADLMVSTPVDQGSATGSTQRKGSSARSAALGTEEMPLFVSMLLSVATLHHATLSTVVANRTVQWSGVHSNLKETAAADMQKADVLEQNLTAMADDALSQFQKPAKTAASVTSSKVSVDASSQPGAEQQLDPEVDLLRVPSPTDVRSHLTSGGNTVHPLAHVDAESGTALPTSAIVASTHTSVPVPTEAAQRELGSDATTL